MPTYVNYFYNQYVDSYTSGEPAVGDFREPLPTAWGFRWLYNPLMGTKVRVFKRASFEWAGEDDYEFLTEGVVHDLWLPDYAGVNPADPPEEMYALDCRPYTYYAWDEDENPTSSVGGSTGPSCPPNTPECTTYRINILPLETQEVDIAQFVLPDPDNDQVPSEAGWMMLIFPYSNWPVEETANFDREDDQYQTYVSVRYDAQGTFSAAMPAAVLGSILCFPDDALPWLHVGRYSVTNMALPKIKY
jgi:hypothetical protein